MNILITGGAGYIGSELVDYLIKDHGRIIYDCEPGDWERGKCEAPKDTSQHKH